jgi:hypothetical protein
MRFAYADPPYLGQCYHYDHYHPDGSCWDDLATHCALIERLTRDYPDGWAMSLSTPSLQTILPLCPETVRIAAWVKPFAAFKRNVRIAYTWEPVIFHGGRTSSRDGARPNRDHLDTPPALSEPITMKKGLTGAKPERFCRWVMDLLGWKPGDWIDDLYVGTGVFDRVLAAAAGTPEEVGGQATLNFDATYLEVLDEAERRGH